MLNTRYVELLTESAQLMQLLGENAFRIRAFERAARLIEDHASPISEMVADDSITTLPGIGKGMAAELREYYETRSSENLERLRAALPQDILTLFQIRGLGPKRIRLLWETLAIKNIQELESAAQSGQLAEVQGFGAKTVENILQDIRRVRSDGGRLPFDVARRAADEVLSYLRAVPEVARAEVAGSLRRGRITVKDLDFVVASTEPNAVMAAFTAMPNVEEVVAQGDTKAAVVLEGQIPCDLRVVSPEVFGATLHHFTGSKAHNIHLRKRANDRGLRISEYGVFKRGADDDETPIACATEADIFEAVGLPFIPPELREDSGEIEAAEAGDLPDLITTEDLRGDLHMHSTWSDGRSSIREMAEAAQALGHSYICITDHSQSLYVANGLTRERLLAQLEEIREVNEALDGFRVLAGLEVDILADGRLDMDEETLSKLDWVVGSVHLWTNQTREQMTDRVVRAVRSGYISALGHPTGRIIGARSPYEIDLAPVLEACAECNVAVEVNASPTRLDLDSSAIRPALRDPRLRFVINTDAHTHTRLARLEFGVMTGRRGWLPRGRVVNTLPLDELLATIRKPGSGVPAP